MSEQTPLLPKVAAGEQPAVALCVERYGPLIWSLALRFHRNRHDAEDAVQEIFVEIWKSADRFDANVAKEKTFIAMIARRRLIDRMRKQSRHMPTVEVSELDAPPAPQADAVEINDEATLARRAMGQLPQQQQEVLQLAIDRGMSHSQIADELDLPLGTVKTRVRRGLIAIRQKMGVGDSGQMAEAAK